MNSPAPTALMAEDEPLLAAHLCSELAQLWPELQIVAQVGDGDSAWRQAIALQPQVCFLDIRMPGMNGLEAAQALAEEWPDEGPHTPPFPLLVFVTAYDEYAVRAFEAQAVDYLLKPLQRERLALCVQRLQKALDTRRPTEPDPPPSLQATMDQLRALLQPDGRSQMARLDVLQVGIGNAVHLVPVEEVIYFEAADKYLRVVTAEREHLVRLSLRELLPQLDPHRFWQVHRGTVVQVRAVHAALRDEAGRITLQLRGRPERLPVSRLYAHRFRAL